MLFGGANYRSPFNSTFIYCVAGPKLCAVNDASTTWYGNWAQFDLEENTDGEVRLDLLARYAMTMSSVGGRALVFGGSGIYVNQNSPWFYADSSVKPFVDHDCIIGRAALTLAYCRSDSIVMTGSCSACLRLLPR